MHTRNFIAPQYKLSPTLSLSPLHVVVMWQDQRRKCGENKTVRSPNLIHSNFIRMRNSITIRFKLSLSLSLSPLHDVVMWQTQRWKRGEKKRVQHSNLYSATRIKEHWFPFFLEEKEEYLHLMQTCASLPIKGREEGLFWISLNLSSWICLFGDFGASRFILFILDTSFCRVLIEKKELAISTFVLQHFRAWAQIFEWRYIFLFRFSFSTSSST